MQLAAPELLAHVGAESFCGPSSRCTCPAIASAAYYAKSIGIPADVFRDIVKGGDEDA